MVRPCTVGRPDQATEDLRPDTVDPRPGSTGDHLVQATEALRQAVLLLAMAGLRPALAMEVHLAQAMVALRAQAMAARPAQAMVALRQAALQWAAPQWVVAVAVAGREASSHRRPWISL